MSAALPVPSRQVSLARALYSQADVYLFDDVLSAVDAHVGAAIFQKAILGELADKTRVLVTHGMQYLAQANHVLTMSNGGMAEYGTYKDLTSSGSTSNLAKLVETCERVRARALSETSGVSGRVRSVYTSMIPGAVCLRCWFYAIPAQPCRSLWDPPLVVSLRQ